LAGACALILSGCGGGGGSPAGGNAAGPASTSTSASTSGAGTASLFSAISAANSTSAASNAYAAADRIGNLTMTSSRMTLTGVSIQPAGGGALAAVLGLVKQAYAAGGPAMLTGATTSVNCNGGGTFTQDARRKAMNVISDGDSLSINANGCIQDGAASMDGTITIAISGVSGDILHTDNGTVTLTTTLGSLSFDDGKSAKLTLVGDMKIVASATTAGRAYTVSGKSLQEHFEWPDHSLYVRTLASYTGAIRTDGAGTTTTASFDLSGVTGKLRSFSYHVETVQPLFNPAASGDPASGTLLVRGNASSVMLTALDASRVRVDYSARGDGVITQTNTVDWTSFLATQ